MRENPPHIVIASGHGPAMPQLPGVVIGLLMRGYVNVIRTARGLVQRAGPALRPEPVADISVSAAGRIVVSARGFALSVPPESEAVAFDIEAILTIVADIVDALVPSK